MIRFGSTSCRNGSRAGWRASAASRTKRLRRTLNPQPETRNRKLERRSSNHETRNSKHETLDPKHETRNPERRCHPAGGYCPGRFRRHWQALLRTFAARSLHSRTTFAGPSLDIRGTFRGYGWRLPWTLTALSEDIRGAFWGHWWGLLRTLAGPRSAFWGHRGTSPIRKRPPL